MKKNELQKLREVSTPLAKNEEGKLKGGFSAFAAPSSVSYNQSVNVTNERGEACACSCHSDESLLREFGR